MQSQDSIVCGGLYQNGNYNVLPNQASVSGLFLGLGATVATGAVEIVSAVPNQYIVPTRIHMVTDSAAIFNTAVDFVLLYVNSSNTVVGTITFTAFTTSTANSTPTGIIEPTAFPLIALASTAAIGCSLYFGSASTLTGTTAGDYTVYVTYNQTN